MNIYAALSLILTISCIDGAVAAPTAQSPAAAEAASQPETRQQALESALAPIKSKAEIEEHLATVVNSPLNELSSNARWEFVSGLVFTDKGLASFSYEALARELTPTQIYRILSLFGAQRTTAMIKGARISTDTDRLILEGAPAFSDPPVSADGTIRRPGVDYDNYWCSSKATCSNMIGSICIGSNC